MTREASEMSPQWIFCWRHENGDPACFRDACSSVGAASRHMVSRPGNPTTRELAKVTCPGCAAVIRQNQGYAPYDAEMVAQMNERRQ